MKDKDIMAARRALATRLKTESTSAEYATVSEVDEKLRSCTVSIEGVPYTNVLLYTLENEDLKGFCMIPKVDSRVLVARIGASNELYVAMFSEIDRVLLTVGDKVEAAIDDKELTYSNDKVTLAIKDNEVHLDADKVIFNGGDNKGLIQIEKLTAKVNDMIDTFNKHVHPGVITAVAGGSGAPATGTPGNTQVTTSLAQKLNKTDYEDTKITH